jgi:hypothetical protein
LFAVVIKMIIKTTGRNYSPVCFVQQLVKCAVTDAIDHQCNSFSALLVF